jgi:hypothetical protein
MPTQEFALDAAGSRRVQVVQETDLSRGNLTVLLDRSMIGSLSQEELLTGRELPLTDGSVLKIQVVDKQVQVLRNNEPLLPYTKPKLVLPAPIRKRFLLACGVVFLIGGFNTLIGLVSTLSQNPPSVLAGFDLTNLVVGLLFLLLGFFVVHKSTLALCIAITILGLDAILSLFLGDLRAALLHILPLGLMIQGLRAIRKIHELEAARPAG